MIQPSDHCCGPPLGPHRKCQICLVLKTPVAGCSTWGGGLNRVEQRGRITSLGLLDTFFLKHSRICLAFWATRRHCWLMSSFLFTSIPNSFLTGLLLIPSFPVLIPRVALTQGQDLLNLITCSTWGVNLFGEPTPSVYAAPPGWHPDPIPWACQTHSLALVISKFESALNLTVTVSGEDIL